ncbi:RusA family crossover junction endodeoxyribonuclease [Taklimakanibacter lacteus]|uniref:RusA family crossover junction endodeoxyribonuclease n=1 Tax=Taklimakanibacter lacteus TaxID=2268456 RepID=UPI000E66384D
MELFDFVVRGTPRTPQTKSPKARADWKERVKIAAASAWPAAALPMRGELSARIAYFFTGSTDLDVDNIIKPILDSLEGLAFDDDNLIFEVTARKTQKVANLTVREAPPCLVDALSSLPEFVFVRIGYGPDHTELPK